MIGRCPTNRNATLARPIERLLLTAPCHELRVPIGRFPTNRNASFDPLRKTPRPDWSVLDQSERFVSPTNRKAPFDGSEELRVPIGRFPKNRNASLARPIRRFLLTAPKNSASRLVGSRPIETLR